MRIRAGKGQNDPSPRDGVQRAKERKRARARERRMERERESKRREQVRDGG